jgi:acetylornithine deacetylase
MIQALLANAPRPAAVIVGEPTTMQLVSAHKGIMALKTTVTGHEAHSSQLHRGVSAVMTAARLITFLDDLNRRRQRETPPDPDFEPSYTTVHVGVVKGGTAINIISRQCEFVWDIRNIPSDDPQTIIDAFNAYCRQEIEPAMQAIAPACGVHTKIFANAPALKHEPDSPAMQLAQALTGTDHAGKAPYAAEAGQFQQAGLPAVICGPGSIDQAHQPNEFITLEQVDAGVAFIQRLIARLSA